MRNGTERKGRLKLVAKKKQNKRLLERTNSSRRSITVELCDCTAAPALHSFRAAAKEKLERTSHLYLSLFKARVKQNT